MLILFKVLFAQKGWELRIKPDFIRQAWALQTCFLLPTSVAMSLLSASALWPASGKAGLWENLAKLREGDLVLAAEKWRDIKFNSFWDPYTKLSTVRRRLHMGFAALDYPLRKKIYSVSYKTGIELHSFKMQLVEERLLCPPGCALLEEMPNAQKTTVHLHSFLGSGTKL